ncbi:TPA: MobC family plasmid mobilization relaxosome protein [Streptococcus pneumoniae]
MSEQYRDIRKEVNLTADELKQIEKMMEVDNYRHFSSFVTINTDTYDQLVFELRRIGNNINQIARAINQSRLISQEQLQELSKGVGELIKEVDKEFQVEVKRLKEFHGSY